MNRRELLKSLLAASACASVSAQSNGHRSLKSYVRGCGSYVGTVSDRGKLVSNPVLEQIITKNFNLLTPENCMQWHALRPSQFTFQFSDSDWFMSFCRTNGLAVQGHNLCWNTGNPAWLESTINKYNAKSLLTNHITTVMKRYAGQISSWIVVNEPLALWFKRPDGLCDGPWLRTIGPEYIDLAFETAREADPKAVRVLNVHHVEQDGDDHITRLKALDLVRALLGRGVPVQALGIESHLDASRALGGDDFRNFIKTVKQMGLQVFITELDVSDQKLTGSNQQRDAAVAKTYSMYLDLIASVVDPPQVSFWSVTDQGNWLDWAGRTSVAYRRSDGSLHRPGLLDLALQKKPAWAAVENFLMHRRC